MNTLDARVKLFIILLLSSLAVFTSDIAGLALLLSAAFILTLLHKVPIIRFLVRLKHFIGLFVIITIIQGIFTGGERIITLIPGISLTWEGIEAGISITLRMFIVLLSAMLLSTSSPTELVTGLVSIGLPYEIAFMAFLGIKFLPYLGAELKDSFVAVQLAGADLKRTPMSQKLSLFVYILTPAVAAALIRARDIAVAAESRGFRAYSERSYYRKPKMKASDWLVLCLAGISGFGFILMNSWRIVQ
jgi:energy-coupling factor transport system permease protein